jgi:hypothetical protein
MRAAWMFVLLAVVYSAPSFGQCLHGPGEDPAQKTRRQTALRFVRAVNTAEANEGMRKAKKYLPMETLTLETREVEGFEAQFTTDGKTYSLILKDKTDPCGFAFSTNQAGVIFQGYPIDYEVQPVKK